ncbi:hypothetical protein ATE84_3875 [Aquimarina sp. MAR_2010_214]|uniref:hypothetical protein n=1 Tax=Aquimarina sp. MAR_2010_214 TaxID=1250026 RepID=UPI000C70D199|nr:hypothetical protein [Aquimarina sp. MAR_2010_214]PKV51777.1 hypothetical protein ATE84_3875 [Aquimarina sp. MAR_2010_214]
MKKLLLVFPILGMLFFASCDRDETNETTDITGETEIEEVKSLYDFHTDIKIQSDEGSEAIMRVFSNSEQELSNYSNKNMMLVEIGNKETLKQSLTRHGVVQEGQENSSEEEKNIDLPQNDDNIVDDIAFQLVKITKRNPNVKYAVSFIHPETNSSKASWKTYTHLSPVNSKFAEILRHSVVRRVYYGLRFKEHSYNSWTNIVSEWKKVKNGQSFSHHKDPCYQFRMRVKTKKRSAYTVSFGY